MRWWPAAGGSRATLAATLAAALDAVASGASQNRKQGRRKELYLLALGPGSEPSHLLKRNRYDGMDALRRRLTGSKARRELALAERIAALGLATPVPLAAGERREGVRVRACYLLLPFVAGARDLRRVLAEPLAPRERRALARAFGAFARRMHDAGVDQDDFQPNNFLLGPRGPDDLLLIDCERLALRRSLTDPVRAARLAKLARELPAASRGDRARFLRAYAGGEGAAFVARWRQVEHESAALAARDARRLRRVIAGRGRRYRPFELAGWRGLRAAEAGPDALAHGLAPLLAAPAPDALTAIDVPGAPTLLAAGSHFALAFSAQDRKTAEGALASALLLARRGLSPHPVALLRRRGVALLVFAEALPRRLDPASSRAEREAWRPSLALLLDRLAALGELGELRAEHFAEAPAGAPLALQLLVPLCLRASGRGTVGGLAARRALAARLLGLDTPARPPAAPAVQGPRR